MPDYRYDIYDTAVFGAAAATTFDLFQVPQGADATHTESFTNARGSGQFPVKENFLIDWIGVIYDYNTVLADIPKIQVGSFLKVIVNNFEILKAPLARFIANSAYGGHYSQAAAADEAVIGLIGNGYFLDIPILIPGGTQFKVQLFQNLAITAASNMKTVLCGKLSIA